MKAIIYTSIIILTLGQLSLNAQELPFTLSSSDMFWYSISDLSGLHDNDKIQIWEDRSGSSNHAIQNSAAYRPLYATDEDELINGVPSVYFNGHNRMLNIENTSDINIENITEEKSLMVFIKTSDNVEDMQVIYEEGGQTRGFNLYVFESKVYATIWNRADDDGLSSNNFDVISISADIEISKDYMISVLFDSNDDSFSLYLNGSLVDSTNGTGAIYPHSGAIGIGGVSGYTRTHIGVIDNAYFEGYLSEFVLFDIDLSDEELDALEDFLGPTYGFDHTGTLPVEMISCSASIENNLAYIYWSTASEINNDFFTIERSNDLNNWYTLGTVTGAGNTNDRNDYEFVDFENVNGTVYYRILQTDFDGTTEAFDVFSVNNTYDNSKGVQLVSTQSVNGVLTLDYSSESNEPIIINIYSVNGSLVFKKSVNPVIGLNTEMINIPVNEVVIINIVQRDQMISERIVGK